MVHRDLVKFADQVVNLPAEQVRKHRKQVNALRDRLARKIADDPDFALVKMLHSGSVAKGTALRTINDMDVAVYVRETDAPEDGDELLDWLADRLRDANPNMSSDQFTIATHCVSVNFRGSGLDVDVVPVLYDGDEDDRGNLLNRDTGAWLETSVRLHLEFIRKRKANSPKDFAQVIRLLKWWVRLKKTQNANFRFKSFMVELLCTDLLDDGLSFQDYPEALQRFFAHIVQTRLRGRIVFSDYYDPVEASDSSWSPMQIFDPVNPINNVASNYSDADRDEIVEACADALDAVGEAQYSDTKGRAVALWKEVLGPSFKVDR